MFDLRELKLMFLDPTDLIINNINNYKQFVSAYVNIITDIRL